MKNILVLSHVLPFPGFSGQQQRVKNTLKSLRDKFQITFVTFGNKDDVSRIENELSVYCEKVICLPSKYSKSKITKLYYRGLATANSLATGLKPSNYIIGELEFTPKTLSPILDENKFDCALFEYWHAFKAVNTFRKRGIPTILDMHNVLWQSYIKQQNEKVYFSKSWAKNQLKKYTTIEEKAWNEFDGIIAINKEEFEYVKRRITNGSEVFYTPMGIDLNSWQFDWSPSIDQPKVAYYGGLNSHQNQQSALYCYQNIMPKVWKKFPDAEFWIIGSNPPEKITKLTKEDSRVVVTGFVEDIKSVLKKMSVVVCPWKGKYGFRSRLIEVMALGIPLVTTEDAVDGMELQDNKGILLGEKNDELLEKVLKILRDKEYAKQLSKQARLEIESLYSFENTYDKLTSDLNSWLDEFSYSRSEYAQMNVPAFSN